MEKEIIWRYEIHLKSQNLGIQIITLFTQSLTPHQTRQSQKIRIQSQIRLRYLQNQSQKRRKKKTRFQRYRLRKTRFRRSFPNEIQQIFKNCRRIQSRSLYRRIKSFELLLGCLRWSPQILRSYLCWSLTQRH